jgi:hypothetical protein
MKCTFGIESKPFDDDNTCKYTISFILGTGNVLVGEVLEKDDICTMVPCQDVANAASRKLSSPRISVKAQCVDG